MGENTTADATFADLAKIYSALRRPREAALAHAARAANAQDMGNSELAQTLLQEAKATPNRPRDDAELEVWLNFVDGSIAGTQGDPKQARSFFRESQRRSLDAFGPSDWRTLRATVGLVMAERQLGNFDGALALHAELETAAARSNESGAKELITLQLDRAEILYQAGLYAETVTQAETALPRCVGQLGPKDDVCGRLRYVKVQASLRLGQTAVNPSDQARIEEIAADSTSPFVSTEAMLLLFKLESARGTSPRQAALFDRVLKFGQSGSEVALNPLLKAKALLTLAESAVVSGSLGAAQAWIEQALSFVNADDRSSAAVLIRGVGQSLMGVVKFRQGRHEQALEAMQLAQRHLASVLGAMHPLTQIFALNMVGPLSALGQVPQALDLVVRGEPTLRRALGENSPTYIRVQRLKLRLQEPLSGKVPLAPDLFS